MMRSSRPLLLGTLVLGCLLLGSVARAQMSQRPSDGVAVPFQGVATTDDASSIYVNPANLAFGTGPEARLTVVWTGEQAPLPLRGYSLDLGVPFWILASGLRLDWLDPPGSTPAPYTTQGKGNRTSWVRWANAIRLGDFAALGTTLAWSSSEAETMHDVFTVASGLTLRPNRFMSAALVARDWNRPESALGTPFERSFDLAAALRPIDGRRVLEIGLEGSYRDDGERWVPAANVAVDIPYVGRLRTGAQLLDASEGKVLASAGLEVNLDSLQVTAGAVFGNALTGSGTGFVAGAAVRGFTEEPSIPTAAKLVRIRLEATPGVRGHTSFLRALWRLADDPEVDGVLLVLRSSPTMSLAYSEELTDALRLLKARGKKVLCHLEDAGGRELFVCSEADRIAINPAGGIRFSGLSTRYFYLGGLLEKLGVRADFVRIGDHKLAPEQFDAGPSEVGRRDHRDLLQQYDRVFVEQLARGRGMSGAQVSAAVAKGPFIAPEARDAKLVDQLVYEDEIDRFAQEAFGRAVRIVDLEPPKVRPQHWRTPPGVALVYLDGDMIDGNSQKIPIIGIKLAGSYTIAKALKQAREDHTIKAVVFRVETGGGSSLASDVILREAILTAKAKPLVVSMGSHAASGGYYASVAGNDLFANRSTVTGSIGIFYGKVDVVKLLDMLGVKTEAENTTPRADAESFFRPFSDDERKELGRKVKQFYDLFVGRVAEGRKMSPAEVHAVAQGRVWSGSQAKDLGLVDEIGGLRQALERARELASLPDDAPIVELPAEEPTLFDLILEMAGVPSLKIEESASLWVPPPMMDMARSLIPFMIYEPYKPLARMEAMITEP